MSLLSLKGKLLKAFMAAAIISTGMGMVPTLMPQAEAVVIVSGANSSYSTTARANRTAINNVLLNPTAQHIDYMQKRIGLVEDSMVPYIAETVAEMNIAPGTKPEDISQAQRSGFIRTLEEKRLVATMSAETKEESVALGLREWMAPFFAQTKAEYGQAGTLTLAQAQEMNQKMYDKHFAADVKPMLEVSAAGVVMAATIYAMKKSTRT